MQLDASVTNGLTTIQPGLPAVRSIRSTDLIAFGERGIFPAAREIETQAGNWFIRRFKFRALHMGIEIVVDRRAIDDAGNLIIFVIVVENVAVQRQRPIKQRVFRTELKSIDEFRLEGQRVNRD